ncbi:hypothetical protein ACLKA7_011276 [Drosophila subpalustris]
MKKAASEAATTATVTTATIQRSAIRVMGSQRKCTQLRNACRASWQRREEEEELRHKAAKGGGTIPSTDIPPSQFPEQIPSETWVIV